MQRVQNNMCIWLGVIAHQPNTLFYSLCCCRVCVKYYLDLTYKEIKYFFRHQALKYCLSCVRTCSLLIFWAVLDRYGKKSNIYKFSYFSIKFRTWWNYHLQIKMKKENNWNEKINNLYHQTCWILVWHW